MFQYFCLQENLCNYFILVCSFVCCPFHLTLFENIFKTREQSLDKYFILIILSSTTDNWHPFCYEKWLTISGPSLGVSCLFAAWLLLAQAALRAPPKVVLQCVAGHCYYQLSLSLSLFSLRLLLKTHFGETPEAENVFPPIFWHN